MRTIRVCVRGDNQFVDCIVSPPAVPVPVGFITSTGRRGAAASAPLPAVQRDVGAARVGGLLPEEWAALFRERRDLLFPVQPWIQDIFSQIQELPWWQICGLESVILALLCRVGLNRDALVYHAQPTLGPITAAFMDALIEVIVSRCGQEARRLLGLEDASAAQEQEHEDGPEEPSAAQEHEDGPPAPSGPSTSPQGTVAPSTSPSGSSAGPDAEELPGTSSGALGRGPGEPGSEAAGPSEQGRSRGSSSRGRGRNRSAGGSRRPTKRRAGSAQRAPLPCKRRRHRRL